MKLDLGKYAYYIRPGYTDMRCGGQRLAIRVQEEMKLNPFGPSVFIFCGRTRKIIKAQ